MDREVNIDLSPFGLVILILILVTFPLWLFPVLLIGLLAAAVYGLVLVVVALGVLLKDAGKWVIAKLKRK